VLGSHALSFMLPVNFYRYKKHTNTSNLQYFAQNIVVTMELDQVKNIQTVEQGSSHQLHKDEDDIPVSTREIKSDVCGQRMCKVCITLFKVSCYKN